MNRTVSLSSHAFHTSLNEVDKIDLARRMDASVVVARRLRLSPGGNERNIFFREGMERGGKFRLEGLEACIGNQ